MSVAQQYIRWMGIAREVTYASGVTTPEASLSFVDVDLNPDKGALFAEESAFREPGDILEGPFKEEGSVSILPRANTIGYFLKYALGDCTSTQYSNSGVYAHTFTMSQILPSFTITETELFQEYTQEL